MSLLSVSTEDDACPTVESSTFRSRFRVVRAQTLFDHFASDRRHMVNTQVWHRRRLAVLHIDVLQRADCLSLHSWSMRPMVLIHSD